MKPIIMEPFSATSTLGMAKGKWLRTDARSHFIITCKHAGHKAMTLRPLPIPLWSLLTLQARTPREHRQLFRPYQPWQLPQPLQPLQQAWNRF